MSITVLVADDQALVRDGIVVVLSLTDDIEVIGEARDGAEAIALAEELEPDVVLMDLRMPGLSGAEATAQLAQSRPDIRVLVLTTFADDASIDSALRAGAAGYLTKDAGREEMVAAIRATAVGGTSLDTRIAGRVVAGLPEARPASVRDRFPELTAREAEVLDLMAEGASNPEIAERLFLGVSTVKSHINALFAKLGVSRRAGAIALARGGGRPPESRAGSRPCDGVGSARCRQTPSGTGIEGDEAEVAEGVQPPLHRPYPPPVEEDPRIGDDVGDVFDGWGAHRVVPVEGVRAADPPQSHPGPPGGEREVGVLAPVSGVGLVESADSGEDLGTARE